MKNLLSVVILSLVFFSSARAESEYLIRVDFGTVKLYLSDEWGVVVGIFPVALPKVTPKLPIWGRVEKVVQNPYWAPTKATREAYFKKFGEELPALLKPDDPKNAMGKGKLHIVFNDRSVNETIRIHGTNDEKSIGQRVSRGCIRMLNKDIEVLSEIIRNKKVLVVFA